MEAQMTALAEAATPRLMQRMSALERANEVRLKRAVLKRRIGRGQVTVVEVLQEVPDEANGWAIGELLLAQRRWGATRTRKFCRRNMVGERKPVGTLTARQRSVLAGQLAVGRVG